MPAEHNKKVDQEKSLADNIAFQKEMLKQLEDMKEEKILLAWQAPERNFQKKDKDFWITAVAILVLVGVILFFVKEFFLVVALASILFLYYVMSTIPPARVNNKITNRGVYFGEAFYGWDILERFWFKTASNQEMLFLETFLRFPREISLLIDPQDKDKIKNILIKYIPLIELPPRFIDKAVNWFNTHIPLEDRKK